MSIELNLQCNLSLIISIFLCKKGISWTAAAAAAGTASDALRAVATMSTSVTAVTKFFCIGALSSRRAKRAGWPKGLKGPERAFRPFGLAGVLRPRLLHRNGNFVPLAP